MSVTTTISLPAGYQLTVTANAVSSGYFYELVSGAQGTGFTTVAASASESVGPFATPKDYAIVSESGLLTHSSTPVLNAGGIADLEEDTTPTLGGDLDVNGHAIDFATTDITDVIDDDTFATASDTTVATSESTKAYVDANTGASALDDLSDVVITGVVGGEILRYDGADWVNASPDAADMDWSDPVDNNIVPDANGTRDIGSTANRFDELFVDDIIVTNNVDGRDVSTDGTKLDGIESGATADQDADEVPYDNVTSGLTATDVQAAIDELDSTIDGLSSHDPVTLNADDPTQQTLNLSGQELQVNLATTSTDGAMSAEDKTKLDGIEALADVTDEANVTSALSGATLTGATVAANDKVLIQDTDDSDNLKTVTAQSIADLAVSGGDLVKIASATASNSANLTFTGLSSTYAAYIFVLDKLTPVVDGEVMFFATSIDNGSSFQNTNYAYGMYSITATGTTGTISDSAAVEIFLGSAVDADNARSGISGVIDLVNPTNADSSTIALIRIRHINSANTANLMFQGWGQQGVVGVTNAVRFRYPSNIASGTITVYGVVA